MQNNQNPHTEREDLDTNAKLCADSPQMELAWIVNRSCLDAGCRCSPLQDLSLKVDEVGQRSWS